jgi:putative DNA methylase
MIPKECKRLAEVDFPIAVVSKHSAREKSIRHGHPSTLHLWWARRPLAACRAMLLALLLPDPCDPYCPEDFKTKARELLPRVQGKVGSNDKDLQKSLLKFIGDFSNWDFSSDQTYLEVGRGLVKAAHPEETPLVVDPFAGGGSIPLEALRLGCETFASDLNPVACLILKVMLENIPRYGLKLAEELDKVGREIKDKAEKELNKLYPSDPDGARPIAYLWARTVLCESPKCGAEIPLVRSFWLCKKSNKKIALRYRVVRSNKGSSHVELDIFKPESDTEVAKGTVKQARATCPCCNTVLSPDRVRSQLRERSGGANVIFNERGERVEGARLLAVVTTKQGEQGRNYRLPNDSDYKAVLDSVRRLEEFTAEASANGLNSIPDEFLPTPLRKKYHFGDPYFNFVPVLNYGMVTWGDLFTIRQKLALATVSRLVRMFGDENPFELAKKELMGIVASRCADYNSSFSRWVTSGEFVGNTFGRQALPPVWDFCETYILSEESGGYPGALKWVVRVANRLAGIYLSPGQTALEDAALSPMPDNSVHVWFTDPPYYDAVPYADLSDYFFVWLKRALNGHPMLKDPFDGSNLLTPKSREIIDTVELLRGASKTEAKKLGIPIKDRADFEYGIRSALAEGRRILRDDGIASVVFAHKTTEGWEALLSGMIQGGWTITGSWPIATERPGRLRSQESAALATSVHLICRPRPESATVGDWGDVLRELPKRVGDWMERLQSEGIRGADLVFACIGPALEIFSRYSKVVDAEEREIPLGGDPETLEPHKRGFLAYVWEVVGRTALEQVLGTAEAKARNSTAGALEEDARLTALFLWALQSTNGNGKNGSIGVSPVEGEDEEDEEEKDTGKDAGATKKKQGYSLIFDVVRRFAQPLGIHLPEWEGRVIETEKGVVRLLSVKERGKQLFGEESISVAGFRIEEQARRDPQMKFDFAVRSEGAMAPEIKARRPKSPQPPFTKGGQEGIKRVTTTLDRVHAAMLLQASGQTNALRALLKAEQERGPDFIRLANALSALYPKDSEEKRLLDAMLLAMPRK